MLTCCAQHIKSHPATYTTVHSVKLKLHAVDSACATVQVADNAASEDAASQELNQSTSGRQACTDPALLKTTLPCHVLLGCVRFDSIFMQNPEALLWADP